MISRRLECHRLLKIFVRVWLLGMLALSATSAFGAQRQIDSSSCSPSVSIAVTPPSEVASWAFEEAIGRLTPSNINRNGVWIQAEGVIRWGADLEPLSTTLTYDLAGPDGSYRISGDESVDGRSSLVDEDQVVLSCEAESLPETVTTPLISEPTGTRVPLDLTVSVSTPGATLHYTLDGAVPTSADAVYSGPISLTQATYVKVIAVKQGMRSSEVASAYYAGPERILSQTLLQTISNEVCEPQITINVTPLDSVESYGVVMPMPLGTRPTSISDEGVWDAATSELKWGGFKDSQARSFSFKLAGPDGVYSLQGQASFDGYDRQIGGDIRFEQDCIPPMAAPPVFDPPRGRVPVTVGITSATDGAVIRFTLDGSDPSVNSALYESPIQIDSPLTLTARAFKAGLEPSESRKAEYLTGSRPKAIIVAGGGPYTGNALWPATLKVSQYAYNALMYQGYSKDDIWLISPVDDVDFDGNGELDDVDADASAANLEYAITEWAQNASDLIVYLTDHGGYGEFVINNLGASPDLVNVGQLDTWFDDLQSESSARITLIYDACQSGTFVEGLLPPSGSDRIVLTSASNQPALFLEGGVLSFSYQFWAAVFYKGKFYDAFLAARDQMQSEQRPLLDANGNGIANEKADRALVQNIVIGRGAVAASVPPELQAVSPPQTLNGETSAVIEVGSITALNPITRVWAVMVPPNFRSRAAGEPITELPSFELTDTNGDGRYAATYTQFTKNGTYKIQLYARDNQGVISIPTQTRVIQTQGEVVANEVPVAENATYNILEDGVVTGTLVGTDADNDILTFSIASDGSLGTVTLIDLNTGQFKYRPHANESGQDEFQFLVNDGNADSAIGRVSVSITAVEDVPEAGAASFTLDPGETLQATLSGFDGDGDELAYTIVTTPRAGSLTLNDAATGAFTFDSTDASGSLAFTYTVSDGKATSEAGTVQLIINRGYNTAPVAGQCLITVNEDETLETLLSATDSDNDPITFKLIGQANSGGAEITADGVLRYQPDPDFFGVDEVQFSLSDEYESGDPGVCKITVEPVNDAPVAEGLSISVTNMDGFDGQLLASDIDSATLSYEIIDAPQLGTIASLDAASGAFRYQASSTENGADSFSFKVRDGEAVSQVALVQVSLRLPQAVMQREVVGGTCLATVTLDVTPVATVQAYAVVEQLPRGVEPESISGNGLWEGDTNSIRWGTFKDNAARSFSYRFTADDGDRGIAGVGSFDGWDASIAGPQSVLIDCDGARVEALTISPDSGTRVPVDMTIASPTDGASIYYTLDGSEPNEAATLYESPVQLTSPAKVRARAFKQGLYRSQETRAKFRAENPQKAVLVVGGPINNGNALWPATLRAAEHAYRALLYQGYAKDEIQLLAPTVELDFDGNGDFDDVDGVASSATIESSLTTWAVDAGDLLVYIVGHGGDGRFQITLGGEFLGVEELDSWLDQFQTATGKNVALIYDACRSGSFIGNLFAPPGVDRVIIASAAAGEPAWFIDQGRVSFSYQFWSAVFGKADIVEAYRQAKAVMRRYQGALIDADGNGQPDETEDYQIAATVTLGRGAVSAAFEPQISGITAAQSIGGATVATISIDSVTAVNQLARVWAVVLPPGYQNSDPDLPVLAAVEVDLMPSGIGRYTVTLDDFNLEGVYQVIVYAKDDQGLISKPAYTAVAKGAAELSADTDSDGVADGTDLCPAVFDDQSDFDGDGQGDACDADDDNDGTVDAKDAFPLNAEEQLDTDLDGQGNNADADDDGDGVLDEVDPDPLNADISVADSDQDEDGIADGVDNCVAVANADQADNEADGVGDACDNDDDNDGIPDETDSNPLIPDGTPNTLDADQDGIAKGADNCPDVSNSNQLDTDGDGNGDACDDDIDGDGIANDNDAFALDARGATDSDSDEMADEWELQNGLQPNDAEDRFSDDDQDGVLAIEEFIQNSDPRVADQAAQLISVGGPGSLAPGAAATWTLQYTVSDDNAGLEGLGLRIHFDTNFVSGITVNSDLPGFSASTVTADDGFNFDFDPKTDQFREVAWAATAWPGALPVTLAQVTVSANPLAVSGSRSVIRFSAFDLPVGYGLSAEPLKVNINEASLDIDGDGEVGALTDGLLIIRRLFGFEGSSLVAGATSASATVTSASAIAARIDAYSAAFDVDNNGSTTALTDGLLIIRRLFGFEGESLTAGAVGQNAQRPEAADIARYIDGLKP